MLSKGGVDSNLRDFEYQISNAEDGNWSHCSKNPEVTYKLLVFVILTYIVIVSAFLRYFNIDDVNITFWKKIRMRIFFKLIIFTEKLGIRVPNKKYFFIGTTTRI